MATTSPDAVVVKLEEGSDGATRVEPTPAAAPAVPKGTVPYFSLYRFATGVDYALYIGAIICALGNGVIFPMFSFIFAGLLDAFFDADNFVHTVETYALYMLYIAIGAFIASIITTGGCMFAAERQGLIIRKTYLRALLKQSVAWHDVNHTGEVATRMSEDVMAMLDGMGEKTGNFVQFATQFVAGIILGFIRGPALAGVVMAFLPILAGSAAAMKVILGKLQKQEADAYARAGEIAVETLGSIRTVAANCGEEAEVQRYDAHLKKAQRVGTWKGVSMGLSIGLVWLGILFAYGVGLYYGSRMILNSREEQPLCRVNPTLDGCVSGGTVVNVFFAIIISAFAIAQAAPNLAAVGTSTAAAFRIFQVIDKVPEIDNLSETGVKVDPASLRGEIEFQNVTFSYPSRKDAPVLRDFNLVIPAGKQFALVGPSGSGKSTIIALLQRWYDPDSGVILLDGRNLKDYNIQWLRERMGLVLQEPLLFQTTIAQNIAYGIPGTGELSSAQLTALMPSIESAAKAANAHNFVTTHLKDGFQTNVGERGAQLSGGQRQRLAIARALIRSPRILLFDEATSALDTRSERVVQAAIDKLLATSGGQRTSITIAHRLSTVEKADRIVVLSEGRILESGTHTQLMGLPSGLYRSMKEQQQLHDRSQSEHGGASAAAEEGGNGGEEEDDEKVASPSAPAEEILRKASSSKHGGPSVAIEKKTSGVAAAPTKPKKLGKDGKPVSEEDAEELPPVPIGKVLAYQKPELGYAILAGLAAAVGGTIMPIFSIVFSRMVAVYYDPDDNNLRDKTPFYMGMFFLIGCASFLGHLGQHGLFALLGERLTRRLRVATYRAVLSNEVGWFDDEKNSSGRLTTRLAQDAALVKATTGDRLGQGLQSICALLAGMIIAFTASWQLSLVVLGMFPILAAVGAVQMKMLAGFTASKEGEEAGQIAVEAMGGIRTVFAYGLQKHTLDRFNVALGPLEKKIYKRSLAAGVGLGASMFCMFASYGLAFWAGAKFIENGWMNFQEMLNTFFAIVMAAQGIGQASGMAADQGKAEKAKRSIFALIERVSSINPFGSGVVQPTGFSGRIEFQDVCFSYPSRPHQQVLKNVSFTIQPGQTVAFVGSSGSGKSTVLQLLERFYDPSSGSVKLDGTDIRQIGPHVLRASQALVQQEPALWADSIAYNIEYGLLPSHIPVPEAGVSVDAGPTPKPPAGFAPSEQVVAAAKSANAHDFISKFPCQYATHCGDRGGALSGGQKQRIAIARSIARNPKILLLDEATAALDSNSERVVQEALDNLLKTAGNAMTKIIIAHRLATIRNADVIFVMHDGAIVEQGTHGELLSRSDGVYRQLALAQDPNLGSWALNAASSPIKN